MKATGIVRRIDDLGRIVIPKEIRRTLRIRETDPLEIFTDKDGLIVIKKYSPIGELGAFAKDYADSLAMTTGYTVSISDRDKIIAASGPDKKELMSKNITKKMEQLLEERKSLCAGKQDPGFVSIVENVDSYEAEAFSPILSQGDVLGAVIITSKEKNANFSELEYKLTMTAADFLGKQMGA